MYWPGAVSPRSSLYLFKVSHFRCLFLLLRLHIPWGVRLRIKPLLSFGERCCDGGFDSPRKAPPLYSAPGLYRSVTSFVKTTDHGAKFGVFL